MEPTPSFSLQTQGYSLDIDKIFKGANRPLLQRRSNSTTLVHQSQQYLIKPPALTTESHNENYYATPPVPNFDRLITQPIKNLAFKLDGSFALSRLVDSDQRIIPISSSSITHSPKESAESIPYEEPNDFEFLQNASAPDQQKQKDDQADTASLEEGTTVGGNNSRNSFAQDSNPDQKNVVHYEAPDSIEESQPKRVLSSEERPSIPDTSVPNDSEPSEVPKDFEQKGLTSRRLSQEGLATQNSGLDHEKAVAPENLRAARRDNNVKPNSEKSLHSSDPDSDVFGNREKNPLRIPQTRIETDDDDVPYEDPGSFLAGPAFSNMPKNNTPNQTAEEIDQPVPLKEAYEEPENENETGQHAQNVLATDFSAESSGDYLEPSDEEPQLPRLASKDSHLKNSLKGNASETAAKETPKDQISRASFSKESPKEDRLFDSNLAPTPLQNLKAFQQDTEFKEGYEDPASVENDFKPTDTDSVGTNNKDSERSSQSVVNSNISSKSRHRHTTSNNSCNSQPQLSLMESLSGTPAFSLRLTHSMQVPENVSPPETLNNSKNPSHHRKSHSPQVKRASFAKEESFEQSPRARFLNSALAMGIENTSGDFDLIPRRRAESKTKGSLKRRNLVESTYITKSYNEQLQEILQRPQTSRDDKYATFQDLRDLMSDFKQNAQASGKRIIEMSESERQEYSLKGKGVAGGEKFIFDDIFFKFARDDKGIYGGDEYAQKAAGHELRSMVELVNLGLSDLHLPLACILDHLGHRLLAMSVLPIGSNTIIYGSADGGRTFHDSQRAETLMRDAAVKLNLKPHLFWGHTVFACVDLEVHQGEDSRIYVIDAARLWPPTHDSIFRTKGSIFFNLMRPEFLKKYPKPLCSDSLSCFSSEKTDPEHWLEHREEVVDASEELRTTQCRLAAQSLIENFSLTKKSNNSLVNIVHKNGVNLRYFRYVLEYFVSLGEKNPIESKILTANILSEVTARSLKVMIQKEWRAVTRKTRDVEECKKALFLILKRINRGDIRKLKATIFAKYHIDIVPDNAATFLDNKKINRLKKMLNFQATIPPPPDWLKDESVFLDHVTLTPKIKSYPFRPQYDLYEVLVLEGEPGLLRVEKRLEHEISKKVPTESAEAILAPSLLPIYEQLARCYQLLLEQQNWTNVDDYNSICVQYAEKCIYHFELCHLISNALEDYQGAYRYLLQKVIVTSAIGKARRFSNDKSAHALSAILYLQEATTFFNDHCDSQEIDLLVAIVDLAEIVQSRNIQTDLLILAMDRMSDFSSKRTISLKLRVSKMLANVGSSEKARRFGIQESRKARQRSKGNLREMITMQAIHILQQLSHKNSAQVAEEYLKLAQIYIESKQFGKVSGAINSAIQIFIKLHGDTPCPDFVNCWVMEARSSFIQGDLKRADRLVNTALQFFENRPELKQKVAYLKCLELATVYCAHKMDNPGFDLYYKECEKYFPLLSHKNGDVWLELVRARFNFQVAVKEAPILESQLCIDEDSWVRTPSATGFEAVWKQESIFLQRCGLIHLEEGGLFSYLRKTGAASNTEDISTDTLHQYKWKSLNHENILSPTGWVALNEDMSRVMEQRSGRDFVYIAYKVPSLVTVGAQIQAKKLLSSDLKVNIIKNVVAGLQYLQSKKIIHFDLSINNVIIRDGEAMITKFENAQHFKTLREPLQLNAGTAPPEMNGMLTNLENWQLEEKFNRFFFQSNYIKTKRFQKWSDLKMDLSWDALSKIDIFALALFVKQVIEGDLFEVDKSEISNEYEQKIARIAEIRGIFQTESLAEEVDEWKTCTPQFSELVASSLNPKHELRPSISDWAEIVNRKFLLHVNKTLLHHQQPQMFQNKEIDLDDFQPRRTLEQITKNLMKSYSSSPTSLHDCCISDINLYGTFWLLHNWSHRLSDSLYPSNSDSKLANQTPLAIAAGLESLMTLELLLEKNANPNFVGPTGTAIHAALKMSRSTRPIDLLVKHKAGLDAIEPNTGLAPLHYAATTSLEQVSFLLKSNANPNVTDSKGRGPLYQAMFYKKSKIVKKLLKAKANPNLPDKTQETPLFHCLQLGQSKFVKPLLKAKSDVSWKNSDGAIALHIAVKERWIEHACNPLQLILRAKANVNARNNVDETPLHLAFAAGQAQNIIFLIENGADPKAKDIKGSRPVDYDYHGIKASVPGYWNSSGLSCCVIV